jgi:ATP-binding cassette subfamily B protein
MDRHRAGDLGLYRRMLAQARPYRAHFVAYMLLALLQSPIALLNPVPLKIVVDSAVGSEPLPRPLDALLPAAFAESGAAVLVFAVLLLVAIALLGQLQSLGSQLVRTYTGEKLVLDFRARLFHQAERLSLSHHDTRGASESVYRIQRDSAAIRNVLVDSLIPFVSAIVTLVAMLYVTLRIDWQLALVALSITPVLLFLTGRYRWRMRRQARTVKRIESSVWALAQETMGALRVVKTFGREAGEARRFADRAGLGVSARLRLTVVEGSFGLLIGLTVALGTGAVLLIGTRHVMAGLLTLGDLLLVMGYLAQLYSPLKTISRKVTGLQTYLASAERAFELLDTEPDVPERPNARPLDRALGAVEFRDVSFAYEGGEAVLHDVSFDVAAGSRVALTGETGAGKTTLISLLTRLYDPTTGSILLDGTDLRDVRLADLRAQFAVVLQSPVLFSTTIAENIAYARPNAATTEIVAAAQAAGAHHFITGLAKGYDTQVGEQGMMLSGGERQRVSLARAFLRDAPLLILDEPTSSVDLATEALILDAMERLMEGRTVFLITHRPSSLSGCDTRLVMRGGRLTASARPDSRTRHAPPTWRFPQLDSEVER